MVFTGCRKYKEAMQRETQLYKAFSVLSCVAALEGAEIKYKGPKMSIIGTLLNDNAGVKKDHAFIGSRFA